MSAGALPSIADIAAPPTGHSHGHSRGRGHGHNRSARWAQPPPSSLGHSSASSPPQSEPTGAVSASYSYSHASQPSVSHHNHSVSSHSIGHHHHTHTASSIHHDASHTHTHAHGHDHEHKHDHTHGHSHSSASLAQAGHQAKLIHEIYTGSLIALPWIALSWYSRSCATVDIPENSTTPPIASVGQVGSKVGLMTAMTLLAFGCGQIVRKNHQQSGSMGTSSTIKLPAANAKTAQLALQQIFSVGLPIYAAFKVGGFLVAFALLLATSSGLPSAASTTFQSGTSERYSKKRFTIALLVTAVLLSFLGMNQPWDSSPFLGYAALLVSVFVLPPPFPTLRRQGPIPEPGLVAESMAQHSKASDAGQSSVVITTDAPLALITGASLAALTLIVSRGLPFSTRELIYILPAALSFALSMMLWFPSGLRSGDKFGLAVSTATAALLCSLHTKDDFLFIYAARGILAGVSFFAARMDDSQLRLDAHSHTHAHNHHHGHSHGSTETTRVTKWLLHRSEDYPLLHSILKEKDSRSIFYFMCLNFTFMLVQLSYGFVTGSLGLLSDSIHMFFDCLALVVGLCAAVMSKWPPNARFPYGYGKVDTLSGFANGIFLMIISVEIIYEAVERLSSGSQMHRIGELLAVSVAGLLVNLVGIFSFEHGHHHHGHDHGHDHSHGNENMHGIFLHILADTLGSVAVVISTILVHYSGWSGYDPLASCFIAILIFASAVPLVSSTAKTLLLTLPADTEYNVRETLAGVSTLRGVVSYTVPKFWLDDTSSSSSGHDHAHDNSGHGGCDHSHGQDHSHSHSHHDHSHGHGHDHGHSHDHGHDHDHDHAHERKNQKVLGVIHVVASRGADLEDVRQRTVKYLREKDMDIVVQVERDGDGRCWCGGGSKSP